MKRSSPIGMLFFALIFWILVYLFIYVSKALVAKILLLLLLLFGIRKLVLFAARNISRARQKNEEIYLKSDKNK